MFEEYITEIWECPQCGVVGKVRVEEITKRTFERNSMGIFEVSNARVKMKVYCSPCNSECYRE